MRVKSRAAARVPGGCSRPLRELKSPPRTGEHAQARGIDRRDGELRRDELLRLAFTEADRQHRAAWLRLHQPGAGGNEAGGIFEREDSGERCGDVLAHAMSEEGIRPEAERQPHLRERILHGEDRRLRDARLAQFIRIAGENGGAQIESEIWLQQIGDRVESGAKGRFR